MTSKNFLVENQGVSGGTEVLGPAFLVRDARIEDLKEILEIYNNAVTSTTASFDLVQQTLESRQEWFREHGAGHPIIVAEILGRVAGYCSLSRYSKKDGYAKTAELSVYVRQEFRRQRIASVLMKEVIERAREMGYHAILSMISSNNNGSLGLHRKMGFEYLGELREVGFKFGLWQSVSIFELIL